MIVTSSAITLKFLRHLMFIKVEIEERHNAKRTIQCHRCQAWGNATSNCYRPHRCLKCAGTHPTHTCLKPRTKPAKCVTSGKDHPANATICPVYQSKIAQRDDHLPSRQQRRVRYQDAPVPLYYAWLRGPPQAITGENRPSSQRRQPDSLNDRRQYLDMPRRRGTDGITGNNNGRNQGARRPATLEGSSIGEV